MKIPDEIKKSVGFLGLRTYDGKYRMVGTIFFIENGGPLKTYGITAKHVINGVKSKGLDEVWIRFNLKNGKSEWLSSKIDRWEFHSDKNVDIASLSLGFKENFDHLFIDNSVFLDNEKIKSNEIDSGDEVFITGLFRHHYGNNKNIPIVRVGNIAALPEEKINTRHHNLDAYLIEARSIGGLSGSPVFVNLGNSRIIDGKSMKSKGGPVCFLIGLIHGHYDNNADEIDILEDFENEQTSRVNTGIAIVTPINHLINHLKQIELSK